MPYVRLIATDVVVLDAPDGGSNGFITSKPATETEDVVLEVGTHQAGELAYASDNGKIWLTLRPAQASRTPAGEVITQNSILNESSTPGNEGAK